VHDRLCRKYPDKAIVTLGYGPDFTVLRSRGVLMNIPQMVRELQEEMLEAGINGGGPIVRNIIFITYHMTTLRTLQ
jgi:archaea-specific RecJ-like exonuclease